MKCTVIRPKCSKCGTVLTIYEVAVSANHKLVMEVLCILCGDYTTKVFSIARAVFMAEQAEETDEADAQEAPEQGCVILPKPDEVD